MIQLYEALYNTKFPFINRQDNSKKTQVKYLKLLLGIISHESLRIDLSHIDPVLVVEHDLESIVNIVEILVIIGNLQLLREKIAMKQEINKEKTNEDDSHSTSCQISDCEKEIEHSQNNENSICCSLENSYNASHTPNSLVSSESVSVMSYINSRANKVFNRIHSLNPNLTQLTCTVDVPKKTYLQGNLNIGKRVNQKTIKNTYNSKKNKTFKRSYRSIGTQTSLPYFSETSTEYQASPSSSLDTSYRDPSDARCYSIKKMIQDVSLNAWELGSSENETLESSLSKEDLNKTHINEKKTDIADFQFSFDDNLKKKRDYYNRILKDDIKLKSSILNNDKEKYSYLSHVSNKVLPFHFKQNRSQESSPNSDTTNTIFFRQKFHRGVLRVDSPYTLYLRKRRRNALNALHAQRSRLEQNPKLSLREKKILNNSNTNKNSSYKKSYSRSLSDLSFYSPSEFKFRTSFFSQYNENLTKDFEERLVSAKSLYSNEPHLHDDLVCKMADHKI
ncbi:hypothetical protein PCANB_001969 [Pneumocystis canis]|nr:hypothetical protein PCANB_001969 [Pneumocystis canis]